VGGTLVNNAWTFIDFDSRDFDTTSSVVGAGNGHSTNWQNTWRYIAPVSGYYRVSAHATILWTSTDAQAFLAIFKNGTEFRRGIRSRYSAGGGEERGVSISGTLDLKAGDAVSIPIYQISGANRSLETSSGSVMNFVSIERISSPQTIAMGEVVTGYASLSSGPSIPQSTDFAPTGWTVVSDTHGIFNPSTGELTINRSGFLDISFVATFASNPNGIRTAFIRRFSPSLVDIQAVDIAPTGNGQATCVVTVKGYPVKAGDVFKPMVWHTVSPSLALLAGTPQRNNFSWRIY
jgi:hypothetical protein